MLFVYRDIMLQISYCSNEVVDAVCGMVCCLWFVMSLAVIAIASLASDAREAELNRSLSR